MFFITQPEARPGGYVVLSETGPWQRWLLRNIPEQLDRKVRHRLASNLKHLIVGLELKAALIIPHHHREKERPVLFEPYFQNLVREFSISTFSVLEGLGSAHWLAQEGKDGSDPPKIRREDWSRALVKRYDETGEQGLQNNIERTLAVRDRLHQDRLGARENIDWHAFSYDDAFVPASEAIRTLLRREADAVPETTNLR